MLSSTAEALGEKDGRFCNLHDLLADFSYGTECQDPRDKVIAMTGLHTCDRNARFSNSGEFQALRVGYNQTTGEVVRATMAHLDSAKVAWRGTRVEAVLESMRRQPSM